MDNRGFGGYEFFRIAFVGANSYTVDNNKLTVNGGEGGIRTPDSLATMSDFESGAFNRALPPLRCLSSFI